MSIKERPDVFAIQDADTGRIGIAWRPDDEAGGCEVLHWISDEMVQARADHMAANRLSK